MGLISRVSSRTYRVMDWNAQQKQKEEQEELENAIKELQEEFDTIIYLEGTRIGKDEDGDNVELNTVVVNNRYAESEFSVSDAFAMLTLNHHCCRLLPYWSPSSELNKYCSMTNTEKAKYKILEQRAMPPSEEYE